MSQSELERIRGDLEIVRQAADLGLPFSWGEVWLMMWLVPAGLFLSLWTWRFPPTHNLGPVYGLVVPLVGIFPIAFIGPAYFFLDRRNRARYPARVRNFKVELRMGAALVVGLGVFGFWAFAIGMPPMIITSVAVFFAAVSTAVVAFTNRHRRYLLALAVVMAPLGLATPFLPVGPTCWVMISLGLAVALAGVSAAAILAWQLKSLEGNHESATH